MRGSTPLQEYSAQTGQNPRSKSESTTGLPLSVFLSTVYVKKFNNRTKNASRSSVTSFPTRRFFSTGWAEIKILYFHAQNLLVPGAMAWSR
jgi:hypothetical protein